MQRGCDRLLLLNKFQVLDDVTYAFLNDCFGIAGQVEKRVERFLSGGLCSPVAGRRATTAPDWHFTVRVHAESFSSIDHCVDSGRREYAAIAPGKQRQIRRLHSWRNTSCILSPRVSTVAGCTILSVHTPSFARILRPDARLRHENGNRGQCDPSEPDVSRVEPPLAETPGLLDLALSPSTMMRVTRMCLLRSG